VLVSYNKFLTVAILAVFAPVAFIMSLHFSQLYVEGDQYHYTRLYNSLTHASVTEVPILQLAHTGSIEPLYGLIAWVGSKIAAKEVWFSLFNTILVILLFALLRKNRISMIVYPLVFTNYYLFVLLFAAERLKFAIICLLLFGLIESKWRYFWAALSPLFHLQSVLFASGIVGSEISKLLRRIMRGKLPLRPVVVTMLILSLLAAIFLTFQTRISIKFAHYQGSGVGELVKSIVFFVIAIAFSRDRLQTIIAFSGLFVAAYLLGDTRINMVAFLFALYPTFGWLKGANPVTILLLTYFSLNGIVFLSNIADHGTGYPWFVRDW